MRTNRLENILELRYVTILRLLLSSVCAWPGDELGRKLHWLGKCYRFYLPLQCICVWMGKIHFMVTHDLDLLNLGDTFLTFLITTSLLIRQIMVLLKGYSAVILDFLKDFHLMNFRHRGIHFDEVQKVVDKFCFYCTAYVAATCFLGFNIFNMPSLYLNLISGAFSYDGKENITQFYSSIHISYPFFQPLECNLIALTVFNWYICFVCSIFICLTDLLVILMTLHVIGHIVILRKNIESIPGPKKSGNLELNQEKLFITIQCEVYSEEENREISLILKDCVDHHRIIISFTEKMTNFFGFMLAYNYAFHMIGCCILLLETTEADFNDRIRFFPVAVIIFGELIQISVIFEVVGTMSEKLPDALYSIPWECMDIRNQRSVCIFLHRLQRPIHVTAMGMATVGVTTMAGILKTTFSYYAFLKSCNK